MSLDRSTAAARARLIQAGHAAGCAAFGPVWWCQGCYSLTARSSGMRPRTMEAAYAALTRRERALLARHAAT